MEANDRDAAVHGDAADAYHMFEGQPPQLKSFNIISAAVNHQTQQRNVSRCSDDDTSERSTSRALNAKAREVSSPDQETINTIRSSYCRRR